jgi:hypothetical protein
MIERHLAEVEAAEASTAAMTPERSEPPASAAPVEAPGWLDALVKE